MWIRKRIVILAAGALSVVLSTAPECAWAVNENGVLLIHAGNSIVYTEGSDFGGTSGYTCQGAAPCIDCDDRMLALVPTSMQGTAPTIWWVFLAFPEETSISARGVAFGHEWTGALHLLEYGYDETQMLAVADPDWLTRSGSGIGIGFGWSHWDRLIELYWMAGYVDDGEATYSLAPHPGHGGWVGTNERVFTPIAGYGTLGFGGAEGYNPAPVAAGLGSCCLPHGVCVTGTVALCATWLGEWLGNESCDPSSCVETTSRIFVDAAPALVVDEKQDVKHPVRVRNDGTSPLRVRLGLDSGLLPSIDSSVSGLVLVGKATSGLIAGLRALGVESDHGEFPSSRSLSNYSILVGPSADPVSCGPYGTRIRAWLETGTGLAATLESYEDIQLLESLGLEGIEIIEMVPGAQPTITSSIEEHLATRGVTRVLLDPVPRYLSGDGEGRTWQPLVRDLEGRVVMAAARVGLGRVVLSTVPFVPEPGGVSNQPLVTSIFQWLQGSDRATFTPRELVLEPGEEVESTLSFAPYGLFDGQYTIFVEASSNDSSQPVARIPIAVDLRINDDGMWITDGHLDLGAKTWTEVFNGRLEIVNLSSSVRSIESISSSSPNLTVTWERGEIRPGTSVFLDLRFQSDEIGRFTETLAIESNLGFTRYVTVVAEAYEEPKLELITESLLLRPKGRGYLGELELRNAATDRRAVLAWQLPWALDPDQRSGSCDFRLAAEHKEGRLEAGESVHVFVGWVTGHVPPEPNCEVELATNDPFHTTVLLPVETTLEPDREGNTRDGPPTEAAVRVLSGNPIRGDARLALDVPHPGNAHFDIHDATGRRIWSYEVTLPEGRHELTWAADGSVAAGAYWAVLRGEGGMESIHRFIVLR